MSYAAASNPSAVYFSGRGYHSTASAMAATAAGAGTVAAFNNGNAPSFSDLIDIVNPLQHIPIINTIYRQLTGDSESAMSSIIGGTLYGGPIGAAAAMLDLGVHDATGKSTGDNLVALLTGKSGAKDTMTAANGANTSAAKAAADAPAAPTKSLAVAAGAAPSPAFAVAQASAPAPAPTKPAPVIIAPASMVPTTLGPSLASAPTEAKAAKPAIVSATEAKAQFPSTGGGAGGPVAEGNYLVFGSNGGEANSGGSSTNADAAQAGQAPTAIPVAVTSMPAAAPAKQFATNGGLAPAAKTLPSLNGDAAAATTQIASAAHPRVFPVPARNAAAMPLAVLPPPTTGPGALPGGKSQALSAQEMAVAQDPAHNFLTAYTQALDKYRNAQKLAASPIQPATSIITGRPDPAPAVATEDGETPVQSDETLH